MPHMTLEYSDNLAQPLDAASLLQRLHATLAEVAPFRLCDIKSRAIRHREYRVGAGDPAGVFVHLTVAILSGRELGVRQEISRKALAVLREVVEVTWRERPCDVTVEVREIERASYGKAINALAEAGSG